MLKLCQLLLDVATQDSLAHIYVCFISFKITKFLQTRSLSHIFDSNLSTWFNSVSFSTWKNALHKVRNKCVTLY